MHRLVASVLAALAFLSAGLPAAGEEPKVGVVLLHGKDGMPDQLARLGAALTGAGYLVTTPEMCWSKNRIYDKPPSACLAEVDSAVASLKSRGAASVVVGGMSLGGLAILFYAAEHTGFVGVIAMAPAGDPRGMASNPGIVKSLAKAHALIAAGQGNMPARFTDLVTGGTITVKATPNVYRDFVSTSSPLVMLGNLPRINVPLLWVAGTRDSSQKLAAKAFGRIPRNRVSQLVHVDADHQGTPDASADVVLGWLTKLAGQGAKP